MNILKSLINKAKLLLRVADPRSAVLPVLLMACALAICPQRAVAQLYGAVELVNGGTNNIAGATTNAYGTAYLIDCSKINNLSLSISEQALQNTNLTTNVFVFKQSLDGTTNTTETVGTWKIQLPLTGNTQAVITTNIAVNGVGYLYLDSGQNFSLTAVTNLIVFYGIKPKAAPF